MRLAKAAAALTIAAAAAPAIAGPPYMTDDPAPTDTGHWEIYAFSAADGHGRSFADESGFDLNYGPVSDVQLTATIPLGFAHDPTSGWQEGTGDLELGVKYRLFNDERSGLSAAIFPRAILPTSTLAGTERARLLLPVWLQKNFGGGTSLFGGGGYEINPGTRNRGFWQAGAALTHDFSDNVSAGFELAHQTATTLDETPQTSAGIGTVVHLTGPYSLLASAGPTWADHRTGYHAYAALGLNF